jgi:hypothetical protein
VDKSVEISSDFSDRARASAEIRAENVRRKLIGKFAESFPDSVGSVGVSYDMFVVWMAGDLIEFESLRINILDIQHIFRIMDPNNSGFISLPDLSVALARINGEAKGQDLVRIQTLLVKVRSQTEVICEVCRNWDHTMQRCHVNLLQLKELRNSYVTSMRFHSSMRRLDITRGNSRRDAIRVVHARTGSIRSITR